MHRLWQHLSRRDDFWAWVFILPCFLGLLLFTYVPTVASVGLSFSYWNLLGTPRFVGLENYEAVLSDPLFWQAFGNTWYFVMASGALELVIGLGLALILNQAIRARTWFRSAYFLPYVTPLVSVAIVWGWIYDPEFGILNWFLSQAHVFEMFTGGEKIAWLYDSRTAMIGIIVLRIWKNLGYNLVIFLAGLQTIPESLYESACIDGASVWQRFWRVTIPMLTPTLFFVLMITLINAFQAFDTIYMLTQGGPQHSTEVLVYWMFKNAFEFYRIGPASAIAYILFVMMLLLTLVQWWFRKRWVLYED